MNPLTSQQKIAILREMDNRVSLSFMMALNFFQENLDKVSEEKKKEFKKIMDNMEAEIKRLQVSVKNGTDGKNGRDGKDGKSPDEKKIISEIIKKIKQPRDGKDATVDYNYIFDYVLGKIKSPKDGKDGSPDKPLEIASKLNTLEEKVDQKVIKGLDRRFKSIDIAIRDKKGGKSGGGMGNFQHETKNLTSATTTITTNYKISGNGYAIVGIYYQGQFIVRGTSYTVGTDLKTITLLFTPVNSTFIDIVYIRS